jgi:hypothetical protein
MVKKKGVIIIILILFLLIGLFHGLISSSLNIFLTWIFIGLWLILSIKIIQNIKRHREFNSPHNTAFFVVIPLFIAIFYSIWGYFTGILGENLIEGSNFYFSILSLIFGFPYVIFGSYSLYRCFKKYNVIYIGTKPIKAKFFGFILTFIVILAIIAYWIIFYSVLESFEPIFMPLRFSFNLNLLILFISSVLVMIMFGFSRSQNRIPALTNEYIKQRSQTMNSLINSRPTSTSRNQNQRPLNRDTSSITTRTNSSRTTPTSYRKTQRKKTTNKTKTTNNSSLRPQNRSKKIRNINLYKPIAAVLSQEDFKCIFCFKLPKLPEDKGRGIILCPNCKYPAHADEFRDWVRTSNLCSRCSSPISSSFRNNPKIISVKNYLMIYKYFMKNRNNK